MSTEYCHVHNMEETDLPGDYRACGECSHIFRTEQELVNAHNEMLRQARGRCPSEPWMADAAAGGEITVCPHCTHDF